MNVTSLPQTKPEVSTGSGDHDKFHHYILKSDFGKGYMEGRTIEALCGKKWVPAAPPENYPLCPTCKELKAKILS